MLWITELSAKALMPGMALRDLRKQGRFRRAPRDGSTACLARPYPAAAPPPCSLSVGWLRHHSPWRSLNPPSVVYRARHSALPCWEL